MLEESLPDKWKHRFISLAEHIAQWSRDPSTKVGAVIVRPNKTIASVGFNGFPQGVQDTDERYNEREVKYDIVVHAEANAILLAQEPLNGHILFNWPLFPCSKCAGLIIQSGISHVFYPPQPEEALKRWASKYDLAKQMFDEAGVFYNEIEKTK